MLCTLPSPPSMKSTTWQRGTASTSRMRFHCGAFMIFVGEPVTSHRSSAHRTSSWGLIMKEFEDPIVEEVHQTRAKLLEKYGGLEGYKEHLRELETQLAD